MIELQNMKSKNKNDRLRNIIELMKIYNDIIEES
jgi:hypothetical protein